MNIPQGKFYGTTYPKVQRFHTISSDRKLTVEGGGQKNNYWQKFAQSSSHPKKKYIITSIDNTSNPIHNLKRKLKRQVQVEENKRENQLFHSIENHQMQNTHQRAKSEVKIRDFTGESQFVDRQGMKISKIELLYKTKKANKGLNCPYEYHKHRLSTQSDDRNPENLQIQTLDHEEITKLHQKAPVALKRFVSVHNKFMNNKRRLKAHPKETMKIKTQNPTMNQLKEFSPFENLQLYLKTHEEKTKVHASPTAVPVFQNSKLQKVVTEVCSPTVQPKNCKLPYKKRCKSINYLIP